MKFSRETTRLQLSELPNDRRRCIALAAAHRMSHVYDSWAIPEFAVAQRLCQRLWGVIITKNAGWPKPFSKEDLKPLYPRSEVEFHPLAAVAEDCISALEYALDAHLTGSVQSAAFSLERAYEAAYQVAFSLVTDLELPAETVFEERLEVERAESQGVVIRELDAQSKDYELALAVLPGSDGCQAIKGRAEAASFLNAAEIQSLRNLGRPR